MLFLFKVTYNTLIIEAVPMKNQGWSVPDIIIGMKRSQNSLKHMMKQSDSFGGLQQS